MTTPNRWAIRDAAEVTFYSLVTADNGKPIVTLKTLKTSDVETSGTTVYARGGRGNAKLVGFSSDREAKLTLQDAIFDNAALAMLTGNAIEEGAQTVQLFYDASPATTSGDVTLPNVPAANGIKFVYPVANGALGTAFTGSSAALKGVHYETWTTGSVLSFATDEDPVRIYYESTTGATAKTITITSDSFGGTFRIVANVIIRDEETKEDFYGQLIIPCGKIEDNFKFSFAADGDPSVLDIPVEILKDPNSTDMWQLIIFDATA